MQAIMEKTTKTSSYFLIEKTLRNFSKSTLPTREHVLRRLINLRLEDNLTVNESIFRVVGELVNIWSCLGVVTKLKTAVKHDVAKFYTEYLNIKKNKFDNNGKRRELRESKFKSTFPLLFDIVVDPMNVVELSMDAFITENTKTFFESLFVDASNYKNFLEIDPSRWINNQNYLRAEAIVKKIIVVNDTAERAISMATKLNEKVTTSETEKQMVFQLVEAHQKVFPYLASKNDIVKNFNKI
ncbi:PREDICTED: uncharacterized protein LOC108367362 [Rhagoletis zephyria]|uniref:uncharacterized protein LOC108367362 n=1 Tax=Rhagoletis zephyria TaxID=28612 RepID=UPI0008113B0B|nr:PREDICTED: uncharacterized protein LOC108367362 [Rhagoletis zephyria]